MLFATLETIRKLGRVKISEIIICRGSTGQIGQFLPFVQYQSQKSLQKLTLPSLLLHSKVANANFDRSASFLPKILLFKYFREGLLK